MSNFWNGFLQQLGTGDIVKDYQHGARTFVDGVYRLSPKYQSLFHVFIELNNNLAITIDRNSQIEIGLMAKSVTLPKYSIQNKIYNAYNRKTINQERINYDPVTITFHDDSANVVNKFWAAYYQYYYRDADHVPSLYEMPHRYTPRQEQNWGFSPQSNTIENFIRSIKIYSLHQKQFTGYTLVRPTITSFQHGEHTAGEYAPMESSMQISYEAVLYESGAVSSNTVNGFAEIHYDQSPSPLSSVGGGTNSILGPGGLVEGVSDVINNLSSGNFLGAALGAVRTANNVKNSDLKAVAAGELEQLGKDILRGQNPMSPIFVPTASSVKTGLAKAIQGIPGSGKITNTDNINSQNNQLSPSGQGIIPGI